MRAPGKLLGKVLGKVASKVASKVCSKVCSKDSGKGTPPCFPVPLATASGSKSEESLMANNTTITGNLTREPEIRYTKDGQATAQLGVAVNRRWQDRATQEWQEATSFFDVVCWRDLAENVALSLTKGMRIVVTGRLEQRSWETEDGDHRSKVEITADEIGPSLRFATADVQRTERRALPEFAEAESAHELGAGSGSMPVEA
jgi:single-strand DNA-binding protein